MANRIPPGGRARRGPGRSWAHAQRLRRNLIIGAGQYLNGTRARPWTPEELNPACSPALAGPTFDPAIQQIVQFSELDLVAGQELRAPPHQGILSVLAHQGQALPVCK